MYKRFYLIFILFAGFFTSQSFLYAQRNFGGKPHSFFLTKSEKNVPLETFSEVDIFSLYMQDQARTNQGKSLRVGINREVNLHKTECGLQEILPNGDKLWRMGFVSKGAFSMSVFLSAFHIPEGAELFVYNNKKDFVLGKFTSENTLDNSLFYTQQIPDDTLFLEYYEPKNVDFEGSFFIKSIGHAYRDYFLKAFAPFPGQSDSCQINVACPEGDNWRDQIRSVGYYELITDTETYMCSGSLINNTNLDKKQYFLSACHCQEDLTVKGWVFYFNYQTFECKGITGILTNSVTGADIRAKRNRNSGSDFLLLEIKEPIPDDYHVFYAGWDRTTIPSSGSCIHHPHGDWKKISIPKNVSTADARFWQVNWLTTNNKGTTEPGSSGSPLFNDKKRIIGQLYGGSSTCDSTWLADFYGKFSASFSSSRNISAALQYWLDPTASNVQFLDGKNASDLDISTLNSIETENIKLYPNPAKDNLSLELPGNSTKAHCNVFSVNGEKIYEKEIVSKSTDFDFSFLKTGAYLMEITIGQTRKTVPFTIVR